MAEKHTRVYHITHFDNLNSILAHGGLRAVSAINNSSIKYQNIAHREIQDLRARRRVPLLPGGVLHDYVPFYFGPLSPMLYTISRGNVEGYHDGQRPIVYLVTSIQVIESLSIPFVFTDGHGIMAYTKFYKQTSSLSELDWSVINGRYWFDTDEYPDRKRRRQAEFLAHQFVPWEAIKLIGTYDAHMKQQVLDLLANQEHEPRVTEKKVGTTRR